LIDKKGENNEWFQAWIRWSDCDWYQC
jgi:hypothetical protein